MILNNSLKLYKIIPFLTILNKLIKYFSKESLNKFK